MMYSRSNCAATLLNAFAAAAAVVALLSAAYTVVEPSLTRAVSATDQVQVTLTVNSAISLTAGGNVTMSPSIDLVNATSTGSTTLTVITNNTLGYTLSIHAASSSAMQTAGGTNQIADYTGATGTPWSISPGTAEFGFSVHGADVNTAWWGSSSVCDSGTLNDPNRYYDGFASTTDILIAQNNSTTTPSGSVTTLCLAVEQNQFFIPSGTYTADLTATAVTK